RAEEPEKLLVLEAVVYRLVEAVRREYFLEFSLYCPYAARELRLHGNRRESDGHVVIAVKPGRLFYDVYFAGEVYPVRRHLEGENPFFRRKQPEPEPFLYGYYFFFAYIRPEYGVHASCSYTHDRGLYDDRV